MEDKELKDILQAFWKNELKEIKKNKFRVIVLVLLTVTSFFFMLTDDAEEKIVLEENSQIEQVEQQEKKSSDKKIVVIKKDTGESKSDGANVDVVIGANSDDLYIEDPFVSEKSVEVALKKEVAEIPATPPQLPPIPIQLPPIPDQVPILPEIPQIPQQPAEKFVLSGTAIGENKNAIVTKISSTQGKDIEENIIVGVGDYVQGRQIVDITSNSLIFDDGKDPMYLRGFENISVSLSHDENISQKISEENKILENPPNEEILTQTNDITLENEIKIAENQAEDFEIIGNSSENILPLNEKIEIIQDKDNDFPLNTQNFNEETITNLDFQ